MVVCKRDAHLALNQLSDYRNRLDSQKDGLLVEALNRLMNVFQSRLFLSLLDIQEFYEAILLDPQKSKEEKTSAALEIASRWENISSPSLVASTTDLRIPHSLMNKTNNFDRARSMYHINLDDSQTPRLSQPIQSSPNNRRHLLPPHDDYHHPHLSNLNKSWKHIEPDQQRFDYATSSISLNNMMNQSSSVENVSSNVHHVIKKHNNNIHNSDFNPQYPLYTHGKPSQNEHDARKQPPSIVPVAKPRQKRLKRLKSSQIHHLEEESISVNTDENAYFNENQFPAPENISQDNLLNDDNEFSDRQWALLSRLPVTMEVIIDKSPKGFGFSIAGGHDKTIGSNDEDTDIYVTKVNPGGPAGYESGLQLGDRILSVNGISLIGATHSEAVKALQLAGNRLKLIVERKAELAISEQDSLMSYSSSYSHSKPPMNPPSSSSSLKHITKVKAPSSFHHSSPSNELFPVGQNIESIVNTSTGTGGSGGKSVVGSGISLATTTTSTSLISGSLFDHRDSKQTLNSTTTTPTSTKHRSPHKATITTQHVVSPSIPGVITHEKFHKSSDTVQSLNDYNTDVMIQKNQKDGQFSSSRLSRRGVACSGFPAFSWCGGLQRVTGGCASLGRGHHSLQGSSKNSSRQKLPGSGEQQTAFRSHELATIGARPTPPPKPGPFVVEVILTRGTRSGLGFSITGGVGNEASNGDSGIFVTKITSGGVAETDGRIRIGDRIVQVNDIPLVDVTHEQAVRVLKQAGDQVKLVIVKQASHSSRHVSSTGENKIPSNDSSNQGVLPPNADFDDSGDFHRSHIADEYCVKSSTPVSLSSFHRSPSSLSPTPSSHSASPALETSVHTAPSRKSSSGQIVRSGDSREQQQQQEGEENLQQAATTSKSLQSKHRHSLNYNYQSQLHCNDLSKIAKKNSYTSSMANNENYRSSPDLSNDKFHKPAFYGSTGTNIPCFASTGQELLEHRMVGIIDYAAAASVSNLLSEWPDARLVTLYRSGRKRVSSVHRDKVDPNDTFRRGFSSSGGVGGGGSLGLNIVGGDGSEATFISHIQPDKPAGQSKRIFVGDRLLTVNGVDVTRFGHEKAAAALRDARDRVDLLLVYRPEEYAEFEKHFCRQLKAVGHKLSYKCLHSLRAENNNDNGIEKDVVRADESPRKSNDAGGKDKTKRKTTDEPADKTRQGQQLQQQQQKRQVKKKSKTSKKQMGEEEVLTKGQRDDMITYPNVLLLRCQVDYDPAKENHHQTIPKKVFSLRSGDLVYVINTVDSEWWQAQKFDPATNEPVGPIGLIPSRLRLERKERTRTLHVNFMARNSRSVDSPSVKSNDAYERRKIKSIKPSTSSYSLIEGVSHLKNAKIFKERTEDHDASHSSKGKSCRDSSRRRYHRRRSSDQRHRPLSYIAVTPVHLSFARPVVILGYMKDRIADELLCEFPDLFGTAVPYTTRQRRPNEVEGRDYHFVISKEIMVADIAAQKYLEAGEYNGNLYGTHLDSVFEVSELGLHCLLDVGGPALKRLESAGLPPIAILVLPETLSSTDKNDVHEDVGDNGGNDQNNNNNNNNNNNEQSPNANEQGKSNKSKLQKRTSVESEALKNLQVKLGRLLQHFTSFLTAIVTTDDYNVAYSRVKELIFNNAGPIVWLNSPQSIP